MAVYHRSICRAAVAVPLPLSRNDRNEGNQPLEGNSWARRPGSVDSEHQVSS